MSIPLKLQVFEGPMDLLMHLIEKNKIDIYDIPIVTITDQYLEYVRQMDHDDMNVTSEFMVMAATLLDIKSRMLLPREEEGDGEEEDPRDELVRRLLEYKMYKYMSEELKEKRRHAGYSYFRPQDLPEEVRHYVPPLNYEELIGDRTAQSLQSVFKEVLRRRKNRVDPVRSGFGKIQKEEISVADKELYVRAYLKEHPHADFREMLELQNSKEEIIVTFLVILELMKYQKIRITQEDAFGKILIDLVDPSEEEAREQIEELPEEAVRERAEELPEEAVRERAEELPEEAVRERAEELPEEAVRERAEELPEEKCVELPEEIYEEHPKFMNAAAERTPVLTEPALEISEPGSGAVPEIDSEPEVEAEFVPEFDAEPEVEAEFVPEFDVELKVKAELVPEIDQEAETELEKTVRRHLIHRAGLGASVPGRHAFPVAAGRKNRELLRKARGRRLWKRKKNMRRLSGKGTTGTGAVAFG